MSNKISQKKVVIISFLVDLIDVISNLIVALMTGSATIFSEMAQGAADSIGSLLLVIGQNRSRKKKDRSHPLGYSREVFFWSLLSAVVMLIIGGGLSLWRGLTQLANPKPLDSPHLAIIVIIIAILTNGYAVSLSARRLKKELGSYKSILNNYSYPLVKGAFFRDVIGTTTSVLGLAAIIAYDIFQLTIFDAMGAIFSALLMFIGSIFLIAQATALITGQTLPERELLILRNIILNDKHIEKINNLVAIYYGSHEILMEADLDISEDLKTNEIEKLLDLLESKITEKFKNVHSVRFLLNSYG